MRHEKHSWHMLIRRSTGQGDKEMPSYGSEDRSSNHESRLVLKDGREVFLRPVVPADRDLIIDMFNRVSRRSIYQRFLRNLESLPDDLLYRLTHIDRETSFALAAVVEEGGGEAIIAVGRYAYDHREGYADLALVVRDDWQNLGLGKALLERVVSAAVKRGISCFGSMMDTRNTVMEKILRDLGYTVAYSLKTGVFQVRISV
jgi:acetyltransferase